MANPAPPSPSLYREIDYGDRTPDRTRPRWEVFRRRLWVNSGRLWYGVAGGLKVDCCFMHVPKCGGTSVKHALRRMCPIQRQVGWIEVGPSRRALAFLTDGQSDEFRFHEDGPNAAAIFAFRRGLLAYFLEAGAALVAGHFLFDAPLFERFRERYRLTSIMRDPVERLISHYNQDRRSNYLTDSFEDYLGTRLAWRHATLQLRYFAGIAQIEEGDVEDALATAKRNLEAFHLVGFTENMKKFSDDFAGIFGRRVPIAHYHKATLARPEIDRSVSRRLEALCAADIELHDHARRRFG
jgi:hypothetical protein